MTSKSAWTRAEADLAAIFGVTRRPLSGSLAGDDDIKDHPRIYGESKFRAAWAVFTLWRAVKVKAIKRGKTPVLGLHEKYKHGMLLVVHSDDMEAVVVEWLVARSRREQDEIAAAVRLRREMHHDGG